MLSLQKLKRHSESLEPDDGIRFGSSSEVTIILESGDRLDVPQELARKIFGSADNLDTLKPFLTGSESLEIHDVKVSDDVWVKMDEMFAMVDEI